MAGFYPDVPGIRMAYDRDGTVGLWWNTANNIINEWTPTELERGNNEDSGLRAFNFAQNAPARKYVLLFPEPRDIDGICLIGQHDDTNFNELDTSTNTTNGQDGTWLSSSSGVNWESDAFNVNPAYRDSIVDVGLSGWTNMTGIRAIRFGHGGTGALDPVSIRNLHIYGGPSSPAALDVVRFWDPALNQEIGGAYFDWGDAVQGSNETRTFRIKNESNTLTANLIDLSFEVLTDATPALGGQWELSTDNISFFPTIQIASLAPDTISPVLYCRRDTDAGAQLGLWSLRLNAVPQSYT